MPTEVRALSQAEGKILAEALPEIPFTAVTQNALRVGHARAFVVGTTRQFRAAIVRVPAMGGEPQAFGEDAEALWAILSKLPGWFAVNVESTRTQPLKAVLETHLGRTAHLYPDVYHVLETEPHWFDHPWVRLLSLEDADLVREAIPQLWPRGAPLPSEWLSVGVAAGAITGGRLVGLVGAPNLRGRFVNVGADTLAAYRGQGIARAATCRVAREVLRRGRTPVWSTGEANLASLHVARSVGFREHARAMYVLFPEWRASGGFQPSGASVAD
ncbi:MAG: GNAT family N-acetyltransferase [Thermoplasmata archaeon]